MLQAGRSKNAGGYRFGFQGQEADNKIGGLGQHTTAQFWEYDTWAVKRWNLDPKPNPAWSDYAVFANNPVINVDVLGDKGEYYTKQGEYLGSDGIKDNLVYVADRKIAMCNDAGKESNHFFNALLLTQFGKPVKYNDFIYSAAAVYSESSGELQESFGIASAAMNMADNKITLSAQFAATNYSYGATDADPKGRNVLFKKTSKIARNNNGQMRLAIAGVINAINGGLDYSNGATLWDGRDVLVKTGHYRYKQASYDSRQGIVDDSNCSRDFNDNVFNYFYGRPDKKGVCKNPFPLNTTLNCYLNDPDYPALYRVTETYGQTIFYKELPVPQK
jgi:hypothetical protein